MITVHLRHIYRTCDRIIVRHIRSRRLESRNPNPGLDGRIRAFQEEGLPVKQSEVEQLVEESETDFYNVGGAYKEYINETQIGKDELRHKIVKAKYFKENMPNLLTWSEKEQIRHLADSEPDEWTPEKIAESFPVTVPIVKKLLKYPWKPTTEERIARHDMSAMRNWRELKEGSLQIPTDLREHFLKFSNRTIPPLKQKSIKIDISKEKDIGEFEQIVRRCAAKVENKNNSQPTSSETQLTLTSHKSAPEKAKPDPKVMTLSELTERIKNQLEQGNKVDINDQIIADSVKTQTGDSLLSNVHNEIEITPESNRQNSLAEFKTKDNPSDIMSYPERIRIPKKAYKRGATYKVNDCFYDHDGKFLYRVLGISN